jgi:hypothetical protein
MYTKNQDHLFGPKSVIVKRINRKYKNASKKDKIVLNKLGHYFTQ